MVATHNDHPSQAKHVLARIYVFFRVLGVFGGDVFGEIGAQPACAFFHLGQLKRSFQNLLFYIVTPHNDHPSYVKHVLRTIYVLFTLFGCWVWGGGCHLLE